MANLKRLRDKMQWALDDAIEQAALKLFAWMKTLRLPAAFMWQLTWTVARWELHTRAHDAGGRVWARKVALPPRRHGNPARVSLWRKIR